jgi:hypothetical protein
MCAIARRNRFPTGISQQFQVAIKWPQPSAMQSVVGETRRHWSADTQLRKRLIRKGGGVSQFAPGLPTWHPLKPVGCLLIMGPE